MASFDYAGLRENVSVRLIKLFGMPAVLRRSADTSNYVEGYDSVAGRITWTDTSNGSVSYDQPEETKVETSGTVARVKFQAEQIDGTNIKSTDTLLLTIDLPEPQNGDTYEVGSTVFRYVDHETVSPGGVDVLYKIQVRI